MRNTSYCFGTGRESIKIVDGTADKATPGPGTYDPLNKFGSDGKKFMLKPKLSYGDPATMALKHGIPGPGTFDDRSQLDKEGKYHLSQLLNSKAARWSKA